MENDHQKTSIYRHFQAAREYNTAWLDPDTQNLKLEAGDAIKLGDWTPIEYSVGRTLKRTMKERFMLVVYIAIYAILSYLIYDQRTAPYDATTRAVFVLLLPYILVCYRSVGTYFKAILFALILSSILSNLYRMDLITIAANPITNTFRFILYKDDPGYSTNNISYESMELAYKNICGLLFIIELGLLVVNAIVKKPHKLDIVITQQALYIRAKTQRSKFDVLKLIFTILINPLNVRNYQEMLDRIKYNRMAEKEGKNFDYSKIPFKEGISTNKSKPNKLFGVILGIIFIIIGIAFIPAVFLGILLVIRAIRSKNTYTIKCVMNRSKIEGSWIMTTTGDILNLLNIEPEMAQLF